MDFLGIKLESSIFIFAGVLTIFLGTLYWKNRTRLLNGLLFIVWFLVMSLTAVAAAYQLNNDILTAFVWISALLFVGILTVIILCAPFLLTVGMFINAVTVYRKEGNFRLSNALTLFVGIVFSIFYVVSFFINRREVPLILELIIKYIGIIGMYLSLFFINFVITAIIYRLYFPRYDKDYLIVLGSGLIEGHIVPPLLASRIDRAIKFYHQSIAHHHNPVFIFSGGQGEDELLSEAEAMKRYALSKGIPEEHILVETKSTTTYENMMFSRELILNPTAKILFFTNNFHVLRAAIYARQAKVNAQGIGSKTAFYFLPNAILREFIALIVMTKYWHMLFLTLITFIYIVGYIITYSHLFFPQDVIISFL